MRKLDNKLKGENAITLVALVVTIVILLILAGVAVRTLLGENGLLNRTKSAKEVYVKAEENENIELNAVTAEIIAVENSIKKPGLASDDAGTVGPDDENNIKNKLRVGDFVKYSVPNWTQDEINSLSGMYSGESMKTTGVAFTFAGFKAGSSKDEAKTFSFLDTTLYNSGWRVLSIESDGTVKITTAGAVEGFFSSSASQSSSIGEYILNENTTNPNVTSIIKEIVTPRKWDMYESGNMIIPGSAHCMTYEEAVAITGNDGPASNTVRDTGTTYWLAKAGNQDKLYSVFPIGQIFQMCSDEWQGIRPVVTLKKNLEVVSGTGIDSNNAYVLQ